MKWIKFIGNDGQVYITQAEDDKKIIADKFLDEINSETSESMKALYGEMIKSLETQPLLFIYPNSERILYNEKLHGNLFV